jgi:hypothetical protein
MAIFTQGDRTASHVNSVVLAYYELMSAG